MTPDDLLARVLYRDALMLVIDKPCGLPVHAGPKGGETLDQHFHALTFGLPRQPELAHRLDRETSGCLVLGRHRKALADLGKLFAGSTVEKIYLAVVRGGPPEDSGRVDIPISKRDAKRGWFMKVDHENGQTASTSYRVLARGGGFSLVELTLHTGRTHQIRVHMAALGCPVLGERIYASAPPPPAGPLLHLHSWRIGVPLYRNRAPVRVAAPLPPHIAATISALGFPEESYSVPETFRPSRVETGPLE